VCWHLWWLWWGSNASARPDWWLRGGPSGCVEPLSAEVLRKRRGVCYCHGWERASGFMLNRAKAFTNDVSGDGGSAPWGVLFPHWGHHCGAPASC
jgi:hypothetical protein